MQIHPERFREVLNFAIAEYSKHPRTVWKTTKTLQRLKIGVDLTTDQLKINWQVPPNSVHILTVEPDIAYL